MLGPSGQIIYIFLGDLSHKIQQNYELFLNKRTFGWNIFYCCPHCFETMLLLFQNQLGYMFGSSHKAHCNSSLKCFMPQNVTVSDQECSVFIYSPELLCNLGEQYEAKGHCRNSFSQALLLNNLKIAIEMNERVSSWVNVFFYIRTLSAWTDDEDHLSCFETCEMNQT